MNTEYDERSWRPKKAVANENTNKIHEIMSCIPHASRYGYLDLISKKEIVWQK